MSAERRYGFKAKENGLGWSTPLTWQGWIVYGAMFAAIAYFLVSGEGLGQKLLGVWIPILVCIPVCWMFGEPMSKTKRSKR